MAAQTGWTFSKIGDLTRRELLALYCEIKKEQQRFAAQQAIFNAGLFKGAACLANGHKEAAQTGARAFRETVDNLKKIIEDKNG